MNTKRKGARAEHRAMKILEAAGYCCTRAARAEREVLRALTIPPDA